ncbi:MAG TPA: hypothetical protein VFO55_01115 [Gemmatimonadaceae bacterium]|nr:hypothetical protein [Gemmatimonadaceae bacterium]
MARQLAAVVASTDAVPRLVTQFPDVFLVTPQGDVWRIFDADDPAGETRHPPASDPRMRTRIFIGSGMSPEVRFYEFADGEPRSIGAERLYWQLLASRPRG